MAADANTDTGDTADSSAQMYGGRPKRRRY